MPQPTLQKQFRGLSDFTGLFSLGVQPMQLSTLIQPVLDMSPFAEEPRVNTGSQSLNTVPTGSFFGTATVPDDEIWRILHYGGSTSAVLASNMRIRGVLELPSGERLGFDGDSAPYQHAAASQANCGYLFSKTYIALPGWRFGWEVLFNAAVGQPAWNSALIYQRVQA